MKFSVAYVLAVSVLYVSSFPIVSGEISSNLGVIRKLLLRSSPSFFAAKKSNGLIDIHQSQKFRLLEDVSSFDWNQIGFDIDGEAQSDESGYSVSLSADGKTLAIGARYNDGNETGQDMFVSSLAQMMILVIGIKLGMTLMVKQLWIGLVLRFH